MIEHFASSRFFFSGTEDDGLGCLLSGCARFRLVSFDLTFTVIKYRAFGVNCILVSPDLADVVYLFDVVQSFGSFVNS